MASKASADGALATDLQESIGAFALTVAVDPKAADPGAKADAKPVNVAIHADKTAVGIDLGGVKPRPLLDLWAFLVAHPTRPELAADEATLKTLLTAALASKLSLDESVAMQALGVQTPRGPIAADAAKVGHWRRGRRFRQPIRGAFFGERPDAAARPRPCDVP